MIQQQRNGRVGVGGEGRGGVACICMTLQVIPRCSLVFSSVLKTHSMSLSPSLSFFLLLSLITKLHLQLCLYMQVVLPSRTSRSSDVIKKEREQTSAVLTSTSTSTSRR